MEPRREAELLVLLRGIAGNLERIAERLAPPPAPEPPWAESNRPGWVPPGAPWSAPTRRVPRHGPESEGDISGPVWGAGCGVDD